MEEVIKDNAVRGLQSAIEISGAMVHLRKEHAKAILTLLKEQEAVEPKQVDLYGNDEWWGLVCVCPDCNAEWMTDKANTHYCPNCGIRVKWE